MLVLCRDGRRALRGLLGEVPGGCVGLLEKVVSGSLGGDIERTAGREDTGGAELRLPVTGEGLVAARRCGAEQCWGDGGCGTWWRSERQREAPDSPARLGRDPSSTQPAAGELPAAAFL